jgi:hypothetical protein
MEISKYHGKPIAGRWRRAATAEVCGDGLHEERIVAAVSEIEARQKARDAVPCVNSQEGDGLQTVRFAALWL